MYDSGEEGFWAGKSQTVSSLAELSVLAESWRNGGTMSKTTPDAKERRRESGQPGGGPGRKDEVGRSGSRLLWNLTWNDLTTGGETAATGGTIVQAAVGFCHFCHRFSENEIQENRCSNRATA
jgi:hypothetical protein